MNLTDALHPMEELLRQVIAAAPRIAFALLVLLLGLILATVLGRLVRWFVRRTGLETLTEKFGIAKILYAVGARRGFAHLLGDLAWLAGVLLALSASAEVVGLQGMASIVTTIVSVLPRFVLAVAVGVFGFVLAGVLRNVVREATERRRNVDSPDFAAQIVYYAVLVLTGTLALEQAGFETGLINSIVQIGVAATALSLGIAFALGSRTAFQNIVARFYYERMIRPGDKIEVDGVSGTVVRYGAIAVVIRDEEGEHVIPCSRLAEETVHLQRAKKPPG